MHALAPGKPPCSPRPRTPHHRRTSHFAGTSPDDGKPVPRCLPRCGPRRPVPRARAYARRWRPFHPPTGKPGGCWQVQGRSLGRLSGRPALAAVGPAFTPGGRPLGWRLPVDRQPQHNQFARRPGAAPRQAVPSTPCTHRASARPRALGTPPTGGVRESPQNPVTSNRKRPPTPHPPRSRILLTCRSSNRPPALCKRL